MYGKIFREIFDSSIIVHGGDTVYTFIALIVLADPKGFVRITVPALAARIAKDLSIVQAAIETLSAPDADSTTADHEGRRIVPLSELTGGEENRGWWIVNYEKYRAKQSAEMVREQTRERVQRYRERKNGNDVVTDVTGGNGQKRQGEGEEEGEGEEGLINIPGLDQNAWHTWLTYRRKIRKPLKPPSFPAAQRQLAAFGEHQAAVVEHSIAGGYQGLFAPKNIGAKHEAHRRADNSAPGRVRAAYGIKR